jgi:capsular polysaccharide export protein
VTFSPGIARLKHLPSFLGGSVHRVTRRLSGPRPEAVVGWGAKTNTHRAQRFARRYGIPFVTLEDGFIRSLGLGVLNAEPFSFVADRTGIYYDATRPSDLEYLIKTAKCPDPRWTAALIRRIVGLEISKYNHTWKTVHLPADERPAILLVDQTRHDLSVRYGLADGKSFRRMLDHARQQYPDGRFYVKTHPDVIAGRKQGYLMRHLPDDVIRITEDCNPMALLKQIDHVYVVTSQMGFEALLAGKKVSCFGMPFYAGWGLTEDFVTSPRRGIQRSLETVFDAAYRQYAGYVDPLRLQTCSLERILSLIESHKKGVLRNKGRIFCFGFRLWKQGIIRHFLGSPEAKVVFVRTVEQAKRRGIDKNCRIVVWGLNTSKAIGRLARRLQVDVEHVEDGFIRSIGLGSDFARPSSLVVDRRGIYFDPRCPSDLEVLLNTVHVDEPALRRARLLHRRLVEAGINKYNSGCRTALKISAPRGRNIILVPGQVEDDASIQAGCRDIRTNLELLRTVRALQPQSHILYKPHPDVLAGNRKGEIPQKTVLQYSDRIVTNYDITVCLKAVDEVHTLTSLAGFEALLHGKRVYTYGLPFYAGWGLTNDRHKIPRRWRKRTLHELLYGVLVLYPQYYHWNGRCYVEIEDIIEDLERRIGNQTETIAIPWFRRLIRKAVYLMEDFKAAQWPLV